MAMFNRSKKPAWNKDKKEGGDRGARSFAPRGASAHRGRGEKPDFGVKDGVRPMMHQTICSACGNSCQVPFKPNGRKPVLCSSCFQPEGNDRKFVGKDGRGDREMFEAVCDDCGNDCEVPFRPIEGKSIRCRSCLGQGEAQPISRGSGMTSDQFATLNSKLDAIIKMLNNLEA